MDSVIVMIGRSDESVYDVEVMPDIPAGLLADVIARAFGWQGSYEIEVDGRRLPSNQTLAEAGAWDGAHLIFVHSSKKATNNLVGSDVSQPGRIKGNRKLKQPRDGSPVPTVKLETTTNSSNEQDDIQFDTPLKSWKAISPDEEIKSPPSIPSSPVVRWKFTAQSEDEPNDGTENP